jgi:Ca-activated chloride channel family protein
MRRLWVLLSAAILAAVAYLFLLDTREPVGLRILSGSENEALEPLIRDWGAANGVAVEITYKGSVDIARDLSLGKDAPFDAVWPAHSLWIELGDTQKVVAQQASILRSPVALGLSKPIAARLGWVGRDDITVQMIAEAARAGAFRLAMTSATQSNSGASAYLGFLYAFAGNPDVLTDRLLADPAVQEATRDLLAQVDRSSGSSGWLGKSFVENPDSYDAMFNYEAVLIETNRALVAAGRAPLYLIYPANGLAVADSPLGQIARGDAAQDRAFAALQAYLLSLPAQDALLSLGRRAGLLGLSAEGADPAVWNPDWGIDLNREVAPVPTPAAAVIAEALRLYQTDLRKPSLTVWVLDVSGSMEGEPLAQLKTAMSLVLDPKSAALDLLQPSALDVTVILPFNHETQAPTVVEGGTTADLAAALARVEGLVAEGGTDVYGAIGRAVDLLAPYAADGRLEGYLPAIVAMTDGASETVNRSWMQQKLSRAPWAQAIPIHSIAFGAADEKQLQALSDASVGRLFKAGSDIAAALRAVKGYN